MWYDICSGGAGDPAQNKTLSWPCHSGATSYALTTHGRHLALLKSLLGTPTDATLSDFAGFSTQPAGQAAAGFAVSSPDSDGDSVVVALVVDAATYAAHASITVEFNAGTLRADAKAELVTVLPSAQRLALPLIPVPSGGLECRVPMEAMALAAIDKQGSRTFAIAYVQVQVKANVDGGILPRKTDDNSTTPGTAPDASCVKLAESWCSAEPSCRAFGIYGNWIQLHPCNATMPNKDWRVFIKGDADSYRLLPGTLDINGSACTQTLRGRQGGHCSGPAPPAPEPACGWAPGATPCGPAPPRPYKVVGSVSTGVLEASIFVWHGKEYMLENMFCKLGDGPEPQHYGQWDSRFAGHSYARIRELRTGRFVVNISETIGTSFVSPFVDTEHDTLWLAANVSSTFPLSARCGRLN